MVGPPRGTPSPFSSVASTAAITAGPRAQTLHGAAASNAFLYFHFVVIPFIVWGSGRVSLLKGDSAPTSGATQEK